MNGLTNSQALKGLKTKATNSIKAILYTDLNQEISNFDEKVEEITKKLLQEGLSALESEKAYFPNFDETFSKISSNGYYQDYLASDLFLQDKEEVVPSKLQNSDMLPQKEGENIQIKPQPIVVHQREEVEIKKEVPAARQFIREEDIPVNNALLAETFQRLKNPVEKYDENFTRMLEEREALMLPIIQRHRESDFTTLFKDVRPLLFDLLKRREGFEGFVGSLRSLAKKEKIASQTIIQQLEVKDILLLLVESCSQVSLPQLGVWFSFQYYPLPLIYLLGQREYRSNLDCCLEFLFQVRKPLITNVGTKSAREVGKSSFLCYLFSLKAPAFFSTKKGFTHFGAVDLYLNLPCEKQNYIIADVQSYREDEEFMNMLSGVLIASQIILVHITEKDISAQDGHINLNFKVNNKKSKVIYLWRDYDNDSAVHSELLSKAEKYIEKSENELTIIGVPKLNGEESFDIQDKKAKVMQEILKRINALNLESCSPIVDLLKNLKQNKGLEDLRMKEESKNGDFDKEVKEIESFLDEGIKQDSKKGLTETLLPCLFQDYRIIEKRKKKKALWKKRLEEMDEHAIQKLEEECENIEREIQQYEEQKRQIKLNTLLQKVINVISSNELSRILLFSEIITNWKMPRLGEIRKKYIALGVQKNGADGSESQKNALAIEMDDKDLSLSTFLDEVLSYYESNMDARDTPEYQEIKRYLLSCLMQGAPLNLVNGKTLKFGNGLLKEIFDKEIEGMKNIFVISIIGAQSSAKSTLLNVLFGCGFSTSAGRCTKGIYISLLHHPSGFKIIVIDTEGLLSVVGRDHEFDNLITTMAFSCSHVVIINNKGEVNTKLRELFEICVYAMKHLKLASTKPKIIFALRDMVEKDEKVHSEMLLNMKTSLEQAANSLAININDVVDFSQEDVILLPPAFQLSKGPNNTEIQTNNDLFSSDVLKMRQFIFEYLSSIRDSALPNLKYFYNQTEQLWNTISELGLVIMRAKNLLEINLKDEALDVVRTISATYSQEFLVKGQESIKLEKEKLFDSNLQSHSRDNFLLTLNDLYEKFKATAFKELDDKILKDSKYGILSNCENEFKEIVDYSLRWQKQRFENEWKESVYSWETKQEIKKLKDDIRQRVNEKLQSLNFDDSKEEISDYFKELSEKFRVQFDQNMKQLCDNITTSLPRKILAQFENAQNSVNKDKAQYRVFIPTVSDILDRIKGHTAGNYSVKVMYKPQKRGERGEADKSRIQREFMSFVDNLGEIFVEKSGEETALNIINDCVSRISKMEMEEVSVNRAGFMYYGLIEAMCYCYHKEFESVTKKTQERQAELVDVIEKESLYVTDLLDDSSDSLAQGKKSARHWFREIRIAFCNEKEQLIEEAVTEKINSRFPVPDEANRIAYQQSFEEQDYEKCLKYILNVNKFIRELYETEIKVFAELILRREIDAQVRQFLDLLTQTRDLVETWSRAQDKTKKSIQLGTLLLFLEENKNLRKYFPDLYSIILTDIEAFTQGCLSELAILKQKDNVEEELKTSLTARINKFLESQYENIAGCQARCPMCFTKCTLPNSANHDHHTNCHYLAAFSGAHVIESKELVLRGCFDSKNYECPWIRGDKKYATYDELIEKEFPAWRQEFPRKDQPEKQLAKIDTDVKRCWIAIKDVLTNYYEKKEKTPQSWFDEVRKRDEERKKEKQKEGAPFKELVPLKSDLYLEGYMKPKGC